MSHICCPHIYLRDTLPSKRSSLNHQKSIYRRDRHTHTTRQLVSLFTFYNTVNLSKHDMFKLLVINLCSLEERGKRFLVLFLNFLFLSCFVVFKCITYISDKIINKEDGKRSFWLPVLLAHRWAPVIPTGLFYTSIWRRRTVQNT